MILFIVLGVVVLIAVSVFVVLFYMLSKEEEKKKEEKVVLVRDLDQFSQFKAEAPSSQEIDAYKKRAQELEDELRAISQKASGRSEEDSQLIEGLTMENGSLKSQLEAMNAKARLLEEEGRELNEGLIKENGSLKSQLESINAKVRLLEEDRQSIESLTSDNESLKSQLESINTKMCLLEEEKASVKVPAQEDPGHDDAAVAELAREKEEKEALQYELIKARAQFSGLDRVSFNYKNQLEDFFKKINAVQGTNEQLSQTKNRLEGMLEEIKLQNEELIRKDRLAQFELEKNHSRLASLERECEDLKARVQQGGGTN